METRLNQDNGNQYYTYEKVKKIIESNSDLELISDVYNGCFSKLKLKCSCGNVFEQNFAHIKTKLNNNKKLLCPKCMKEMANDSFRLFEEEINLKIKNHYGYQKFIICDFDNYTNRRGKNIFKHTTCGHEFKTSLSNLLNGEKLCPECESKHSKGVWKILRYLDINNIKYEMEKTFSNCKYEKVLPFDFYLPDYNCCIEYDGEQHYRPVGWYGGEENLKITQIRDNIKNEYCKNNNISLLRIKYNEVDKINKILDEFIDKLIPR